MDEVFFHQLAQLILARPEKEAKSLALNLLDGCEGAIQRGWMKPEETHTFRKSLNRAIRKEIRMIFRPDFSKAVAQHVNNNRRFFEILEDTRMVDYVECVYNPSQGFPPADEDLAHYDLLQVFDLSRPSGRKVVSIPVSVFTELIGDPAEVKTGGWDSRSKVMAFLESKGIEIAMLKRRAGLNRWGFHNAIWSSSRFCLIYAGYDPDVKGSTTGHFFLFDCQDRRYSSIRICNHEERLSVEEAALLVRDLNCEDVEGDITRDIIEEIVEDFFC